MTSAPLPIRLAVDLSNLRPGGENGGVKPFLFETLLWLGRQTRVPLQFVYLTGSSTHAEVRDELARVGDEVVCVREQGAAPLPPRGGTAPRERVFVPPPADLLWRLDVRVLYCPFGQPEFALPGVATLCTVVDVLHRDFPYSLGPHHNAFREKVFQDIVAVADRMQCISHHVAGRMRALYDVPAERLFVTHIAVHGRFTFAANEQAAHEEGTPSFFFYPANAWRHKNHEALLLAYGIYRAGELAAGRAPWPLVCTGHEDERFEEMRALAGTLDLLGAGGVAFRGYVPPEEFGRLWATAGALVFPSLHEGFGIPLVEAMEHDLPVLTTRDGSLPEVGADACLYADARRPEEFAAAMTRLANDPALRSELIVAGRRRRRDFSLERESTRLLNAITALAASRPRYRPLVRGVYPDGWTEGVALLSLPDIAAPGRLTLRFHPMPAPRRVRLRAGRDAALGSFRLPVGQPDYQVALDLYPSQGALTIEIPDAANLDASDGRVHGVRLRSAELRTAAGEAFSLFATP